jgi:hypothetical protein
MVTVAPPEAHTVEGANEFMVGKYPLRVVVVDRTTTSPRPLPPLYCDKILFETNTSSTEKTISFIVFYID